MPLPVSRILLPWSGLAKDTAGTAELATGLCLLVLRTLTFPPLGAAARTNQVLSTEREGRLGFGVDGSDAI